MSQREGQPPEEEDVDARIPRTAESLLASKGSGFTMEALAQGA